MTDEALWDELRKIAETHRARADAPPFETAYSEVARCLSICRRLGIDHPGVAMLSKDAFAKPELDDFFAKTWRLAAVHAEERRVNRLEARGGVDDDAADLRRVRDTLTEVRAAVLNFGWLGEDQKRRHLDQIELLSSDLQRARDAFDVALAGIDDPRRAAMIQIDHRPGALGAMLQRIFGGVGGGRGAQPRALPTPESLKPVNAPARQIKPPSGGG